MNEVKIGMELVEPFSQTAHTFTELSYSSSLI